MSFFRQTATISGNGTFETAESGTYTCRLKGLDTVTQPKYDQPDVMETRYKWTFEATEMADSNGNPFRFTKFTGTRYGNDKAGLTLLLDDMMGRRLTEDEFFNLDIEDLKGKLWRVLVNEKTNQKGNLVNDVISVKPPTPRGQRQTMGQAAQAAQSRPAPRPRPEDEEEELTDPFKD